MGVKKKVSGADHLAGFSLVRAYVLLASVGMIIAATGGGTALASETLTGALVSAYKNHPALRAERARQRGTDENLPQAQSGWRPTVTANGDAGVSWSDSTASSFARTNPAGFSVTLSQPLFNGFKTVRGIKQARAVIKAGQQQLLAVEQDVLLNAAIAYMNVVQDRSIVSLRRRNVSVLASQLKASQARFSVGEITRTDVAQSRARLALARSELAVARANLGSSVAAYVRYVGHRPQRLKYPRMSHKVPKTLQHALAAAARTSPQILAAAFNREAARQNIHVLKGDLLPTLSLQAQYQFRHDPTTFTKRSGQGTIQGVLSVPLYQAGRVHSQIRQARHVESQRQLQIIDAGRQVREAVVASWNQLRATRQTIASISTQVRANKLALDGVRQEALVGSRTTLDILDAERELVNSRVQLVQARRNLIVASYQLIASVGRMTAVNLRLPVRRYDPNVHKRKVDGKWIGTRIDR